MTKSAVALFSMLCAPVTVRAVQYEATSSTQYLHYQDYQSGNTDQDDIAQYFRLNVNQIDDAGHLSLHGYGRLVGQLTTSVESRPEIVDHVMGRLYYLYLEDRDLVKDHLDLKLGRMYVSVAADPGTVDGLHLNLRNIGPAGVTLFGGHRVVFDNKSEVERWDSLWGGSVYLDTIKYTHAEVSYSRRYSESDLAQEYLAVDVTSSPLARLNLTGRFKYDLVSSRYAELLVAADVTPIDALVVRGEYYTSNPTFDQFSFYRFFDVDNYQELGISADYRLNSRYSVNARYAHEDFNENSTANLVDAGVRASPIDNLTLNLNYEWRNGYAGRLSGLRFSGAYRIQKASLLAGVDYDDFRREDARDGSAKRYYAGVMYDFTRAISASAKLEDNVNFYFSHAWRGLVAVNVHL